MERQDKMEELDMSGHDIIRLGSIKMGLISKEPSYDYCLKKFEDWNETYGQESYSVLRKKAIANDESALKIVGCKRFMKDYWVSAFYALDFQKDFEHLDSWTKERSWANEMRLKHQKFVDISRPLMNPDKDY